MKVLIFMTQFYELGGAERLGVELAEELNNRGIHTDILRQYSAGLPGVAQAKYDLQRRGIPAVHFLGMRPHPSIISMIPAVVRLRKLLIRERYNVLETSNVLPSTLAAWAAKGITVRHLAGLHDVFTRARHQNMKHRFWRFSVTQSTHPVLRNFGLFQKTLGELLKHIARSYSNCLQWDTQSLF